LTKPGIGEGAVQNVRDMDVRNIPHHSITLTIPQNVALVGRGVQEGRDIVASRYSDEFWFLLRSKGTCLSGIEDGGDVGREKDVLSNEQMPNRVRHDGKITYTSFIPYITSVTKQCLQPMVVVARIMTLLFFVSI
jgi:hypothetical protein